MIISYFAGGNRKNTLIKVIEEFKVESIAVAKIETYIEDYKKIADFYKINFFVFSKNDIREKFFKNSANVLLSVGYRYIIPKEIFSQFEYAINIHPTLLPKYRGAYSGYAIIENGEDKTGITAHFIDEGIDTGDIIKQIEIPLTKFDTIQTMKDKISQTEPSFVIEVLNSIKDKTFKTKKQDKNKGKIYNTKRKPEDMKIDPNKSLKKLYNKLRSFYPEWGYFEIEGKKIFIKIEFEKTPEDNK